MKAGTFEAQVQDGAIAFVNEENLLEYLASIGTINVDVVIKPHQSARSDKQNRYYFGVVVKTLADHTGFTKDEMHEVLKHKFLRYWGTVQGVGDYVEEVEFTKSTTDLTTAEMEDYLRVVREWASASLGCYIEEPRENE